MFREKDGKIVLDVDTSLYSKKSLSETVETFSKNFEITVKRKDDISEVRIQKRDEVDMSEVAEEFFNFLLKHEKKYTGIV